MVLIYYKDKNNIIKKNYRYIMLLTGIIKTYIQYIKVVKGFNIKLYNDNKKFFIKFNKYRIIDDKFAYFFL